MQVVRCNLYHYNIVHEGAEFHKKDELYSKGAARIERTVLTCDDDDEEKIYKVRKA